MLKKASVVVLMVLGFTLAACSSPQAAQANPVSNSGSNPSDQTNNGNTARPISIEAKLAVGTLDLEDTDEAVTAAEAKVLLPLWQQVKTLGADPNSSASDLSSVTTQIQQAMTADQTKAIDDMNLTATDVQSEMEELGIPTPQSGGNNFSGTPFPTLSPDQRATRTAERQTQAANGGSGSGFGGAQGTPFPNDTPGFRGGNRGGLNTILVDAVINLLTQRAGE